MKTLHIAGRVGRDAELKYAQNGTALLRFTVAVDSRKGQEKITTWISCTIFGKRAEALAKHITKGTVVAASGDCEVRTWQDNAGATRVDTGIAVSEITLLGGGQRDQREAEAKSGGTYDRPGSDDFGGGDFGTDSDIPFDRISRGIEQ